MKEIEITSDAEIISGTLYEGSLNQVVLVIASATGVKQEYYRKFAQYLADKGIHVVTFDYTGIGRSLKKPLKEVKTNAADWGRNDLESVLQYIEENYPKSKKVIIGHSIGGQLIGLAKSSEKLDKIILVAAQSGFWKYWNGIGKLKMWFNWYILFPIVIKIFGYLSSKKLSGMENLPKNVAKQWSGWGRKSNYILSDNSIDLKYYDKIKADVTAFSITDDNFAPQNAVNWMTNQYKNANKKLVQLNPSDYSVEKIGHFGVFKDKFRETIWNKFLDEIK